MTVGSIGIVNFLLNAVIVPAAFAFGFADALVVVFLMPDSGIRNQ